MTKINPNELEWSAIRARGPGGQNVNKVSAAVHLRYDIRASSLPAGTKQRLLQCGDARITGAGVVVIKAQRYRSQERNREDALARLLVMIQEATVVAPPRRPTQPTRGSQRRRVESKIHRGQTKASRRKVTGE